MRVQKFIFDPRQDLVPHKLIQGHPALAGAVRREHPRAEDRIRFALSQRFKEHGQALGSVLPVSMQQSHEVVTFFNCVLISDFLVPAIALVYRVIEHANREWGVAGFTRSMTQCKG